MVWRCRVAGQLVGTDIDADHARQIGQLAIAIHVVVGRPEFGAQRQHRVGRGGSARGTASRLGVAGTASGWPCISPRALTVWIDRGIQRLGQRLHSRLRQSGHRRRSGSPGALPAFSRADASASACGTAIGGCGRPAGGGQRRAGQAHHVGRNLDMRRAGAAAQHRGKGAVKRGAQLGGVVQPLGLAQARAPSPPDRAIRADGQGRAPATPAG